MERPTSDKAKLPKSATQDWDASFTDEEVEQVFNIKEHKVHHQNLMLHKSRVDDDFSPLTPGKPFCLVLLTRSHVAPQFHMIFPARMRRQLPSTDMSAKICYGGKEWNTVFWGNCEQKRLDVSWKRFVIQNQLKIGDALHWEVMEVKKENQKEIIKFKVQIIRGDFPLELCHPQPKIKGDNGGNHENNPIVID